MGPDFRKAEQKAKELREAGADCPLQILRSLKDVAAVSFADASARYGISRETLISMFDAGNQDAITMFRSGSYLVIYREQREREESLTKKVQGMSTSDLDAAISRLKKEQEYKRLTRSDIELGKNYIIGLGILGATALAGTLAVTGGTKTGQAIVATALKKILDPAVFKAIYAKK